MRAPAIDHFTVSREDGVTLVELLVATAMTIVVLGAAVTMLISAMHRQPEATQAADVIGNARNAIEKITADLREGESADVFTPSEMAVVTNCSQETTGGSGNCEVRYQCTEEAGRGTFACKRYQTPGEATTTVVSGLSSDQVFCAYPTSEAGEECGPEGSEAPLYVGVTLSVPNHEGATGTTVLEDGAALHNAPGLFASG